MQINSTKTMVMEFKRRSAPAVVLPMGRIRVTQVASKTEIGMASIKHSRQNKNKNIFGNDTTDVIIQFE